MDYKTELIKQLEELEAENTQHPSFYDGYGFAISDAIETIKKFNYIPSVIGSKSKRIAQTEKLIEEGKIFFDPIHHENSKNLIIGCDFGSGKEEKEA